MNKRRRQALIIFTGGGSAGHVTPNLALIKKCQDEQWHTAYIGSKAGIEKDIIGRISIPYYSVATGKLRRYFSWQNFLEPFKIFAGILQAFWLCRRLKPNILFSKGGFVAFPVVIGAWLNRVPVICHESDLTPGFANKLSFPFAKWIGVTFEETKKYFKRSETIVMTGTPVRTELLTGNAENGRLFCGFNTDKPIILITGGGLGAGPINCAVRTALPALLLNYQVVHLCGKNKTDPAFANTIGYQQFDYINAEMADLFACADLVISRAGANAVYELIALKKLNLLIPLSKKASRGDQILNAEHCKKLGLSEVLPEEELTQETLLKKIMALNQAKAQRLAKLSAYRLPDSLAIIYGLIITCYNNRA